MFSRNQETLFRKWDIIIMAVIERELGSMQESKRIKVSGQRQITIPKNYFEKCNLGEQVECLFLKNEGVIVIRSLPKETEFSEHILEELLRRGCSKDKLLSEFKKLKSKVRPAVELMIEESDILASRLKGTGDDEMKEIFADVED